MRLGALSFSRPSSRFVSRNGARWFTASVNSMPSGVSVRFDWMMPALLTSTSSRSCRSLNACASPRTSACTARSASTRETFSLPDCSRISSTAASPRSLLRPLTTTSAPIAASAVAVALPIPEVPPVIRATSPSIPPFSETTILLCESVLRVYHPARRGKQRGRISPVTFLGDAFPRSPRGRGRGRRRPSTASPQGTGCNPARLCPSCPSQSTSSRKARTSRKRLCFRRRLQGLPVAPFPLARDAAKAGAGNVADGDRYLVRLQPVQKLSASERRLLLVRVEGDVPGGLRHLRRVDDNVARDERLLPARRDEQLVCPGEWPGVGIAASSSPRNSSPSIRSRTPRSSSEDMALRKYGSAASHSASCVT